MNWGKGGGKALVGKANLKIDDYRCGKSTVMNTAGFAKHLRIYLQNTAKFFFSHFRHLVFYIKGVLFHLCFVPPSCFVFLFVETFTLNTVSQQLVKCSQLLIVFMDINLPSLFSRP